MYYIMNSECIKIFKARKHIYLGKEYNHKSCFKCYKKEVPQIEVFENCVHCYRLFCLNCTPKYLRECDIIDCSNFTCVYCIPEHELFLKRLHLGETVFFTCENC